MLTILNKTTAFRLLFLTVLLMPAACTTESSPVESPLAAITPSPMPTAESAYPTLTKEAINVEDAAMSLVEASVREADNYDESVTIKLKQETAVVDLPGLSLYVATPLVVDMGDSRCAVYGEAVWCFEEALHNIVTLFALGDNPEQLSNEEWLALLAFFTYTEPLKGPNDLKLIGDYIPDNERAKIDAPIVRKLESEGIEIVFYYETVAYDAYPSGPMALSNMDFSVTGDNVMTLQYGDIWDNYDTED